MSKPVSDHELSAYAADILATGGWSPGYRVNLDLYVSALEQEGFTVYPVVRMFLQAFGGIRVRHDIERIHDITTGRLINLRTACFHFDAIWTADAIYPETISEFERVIRKPLCIIGEREDDTGVLLMDSDGSVYSAFGGEMRHIADSGIDAIEKMTRAIHNSILIASL